MQLTSINYTLIWVYIIKEQIEEYFLTYFIWNYYCLKEMTGWQLCFIVINRSFYIEKKISRYILPQNNLSVVILGSHEMHHDAQCCCLVVTYMISRYSNFTNQQNLSLQFKIIKCSPLLPIQSVCMQSCIIECNEI